jgi:hypothetical protein
VLAGLHEEMFELGAGVEWNNALKAVQRK